MAPVMDVAIIGAGPAGLIAAERLARAGRAVTIFDRMPSPGRKFLLAGRGGLNLTHSEPLERLLPRYGPAEAALRPAVAAFPPEALRAWSDGLGEASVVGSSGRVFPRSFKASPLLRAWLRRLDVLGVRFEAGHRWLGWDEEGALRVAGPAGVVALRPAATLLALGGASWPRMGSDGAWTEVLAAQGVLLSPLRASNCGVLHAWSEPFRTRFAGAALKRVAVSCGGEMVRGELVVTVDGLEGGPVYALSRQIRAGLDAHGAAPLEIDLRPDLDARAIRQRMGGAGVSRANAWRRAGLSPAASGLLREVGGEPKRAILAITGQRPIERAISSAGGIRWDAIDAGLQLRAVPGCWVAGEMLDWEAPTGGYLLQACFSLGWHAAGAIIG